MMDHTRQKIFDILRHSRYFEKVTNQEIESILDLAKIKNFKAGEIILPQGVENQELYFIIEGCVSVIVDGEFIYHLQRIGDIFGEISAITGEVSSATIEVHRDLETFTLSSIELLSIEEEPTHQLHHLFYHWFSRILSEKLTRTSQKAKRYEKLNQQLQIEINERQQELKQAHEMQKIILPETLPKIPNTRIACKYEPINQIGGDFYDVFELENHRFGILVADVTGHGVPAALLSFMVSTVFKNIAPTEPSPKKVIDRVNDILYEKLPEAKYVTMFYAVYEPIQNILTYTAAGHHPALVFRPQTQDTFFLRSPGTLMGVFPSSKIKNGERSFQCLPGDKLFFYTDGITELIDSENEIWGDRNLIECIQDNIDAPLEDLIEKISESALEHSMENRFQDDATLIGIEILREAKKRPLI